MQMMMNIATSDQIKRAWAFAAYQPGGRHVITSVSKEARQLGITTGLPAHEARQLLPDLRILLYGGGRS